MLTVKRPRVATPTNLEIRTERLAMLLESIHEEGDRDMTCAGRGGVERSDGRRRGPRCQDL